MKTDSPMQTLLKHPVHRLILCCTLTLLGCGGRTQEPSSETQTNPSQAHAEASPLTAPLDYIGSVDQASQQATQSLALSQVRQALEQFRILEGRLPEQLEELVEAGLLASIPSNERGGRLSYHPKEGLVEWVFPMDPAAE